MGAYEPPAGGGSTGFTHPSLSVLARGPTGRDDCYLPGAAEPLSDCDPRLTRELQGLVRQAQFRWLNNNEVYALLDSLHAGERVPLSTFPPSSPAGGTLFLIDRQRCKGFRTDGHVWQKKRPDSRNVKESHVALKLGQRRCINCYYAHSALGDDFSRRCYWLMESGKNKAVLVHYLVCESSRVSGNARALGLPPGAGPSFPGAGPHPGFPPPQHALGAYASASRPPSIPSLSPGSVRVPGLPTTRRVGTPGDAIGFRGRGGSRAATPGVDPRAYASHAETAAHVLEAFAPQPPLGAPTGAAFRAQGKDAGPDDSGDGRGAFRAPGPSQQHGAYGSPYGPFSPHDALSPHPQGASVSALPAPGGGVGRGLYNSTGGDAGPPSPGEGSGGPYGPPPAAAGAYGSAHAHTGLYGGGAPPTHPYGPSLLPPGHPHAGLLPVTPELSSGVLPARPRPPVGRQGDPLSGVAHGGVHKLATRSPPPDGLAAAAAAAAASSLDGEAALLSGHRSPSSSPDPRAQGPSLAWASPTSAAGRSPLHHDPAAPSPPSSSSRLPRPLPVQPIPLRRAGSVGSTGGSGNLIAALSGGFSGSLHRALSGTFGGSLRGSPGDIGGDGLGASLSGVGTLGLGASLSGVGTLGLGAASSGGLGLGAPISGGFGGHSSTTSSSFGRQPSTLSGSLGALNGPAGGDGTPPSNPDAPVDPLAGSCAGPGSPTRVPDPSTDATASPPGAPASPTPGESSGSERSPPRADGLPALPAATPPAKLPPAPPAPEAPASAAQAPHWARLRGLLQALTPTTKAEGAPVSAATGSAATTAAERAADAFAAEPDVRDPASAIRALTDLGKRLRSAEQRAKLEG